MRRMSAADFAVAGAAAGAGFNLAEDLMRRVATEPGLLDMLYTEDGYPSNYGLTLLPGWWNAQDGVGFGGHGVNTALVAAGIGVAVVCRGRFGWRWLLPFGLLGWVVFGHMQYNNATVLGDGPIPDWLVSVWTALGGGQADRFLLLGLLIVAVVVDYRVIRTVEGRVPALPQRLPPPPPAGTPPAPVPPPPSRIGHELRTFGVALRHGFGILVLALRTAREQRELAIGVYRARGRPRRHSALLDRVLERSGRLAAIFSGAALLGLILAAATGPDTGSGSAPAGSFLAGLLEALLDWWNGMGTAEQILTILAVLSLFSGGGLLLSGTLARALMTLATRAMLGNAARSRAGYALARYLSRFIPRTMRYAPRRLQMKYKHAKDFGVEGPWNKQAAARFQRALQTHINDPETIVVRGTFKGRSATHFYNPRTNMIVIRDANGEFISGWRLEGRALRRFLQTGRVGME